MSRLTPQQYLEACDLGIQDRPAAYIRARLDAKCGNGSISEGEKCTKGTTNNVSKGLEKGTQAQLVSHANALQRELERKYDKPIRNQRELDDFDKWAADQPEQKEINAVHQILADRRKQSPVARGVRQARSKAIKNFLRSPAGYGLQVGAGLLIGSHVFEGLKNRRDSITPRSLRLDPTQQAADKVLQLNPQPPLYNTFDIPSAGSPVPTDWNKTAFKEAPQMIGQSPGQSPNPIIATQKQPDGGNQIQQANTAVLSGPRRKTDNECACGTKATTKPKSKSRI